MTFIVWWALGDVDDAVVRSVTVLVIACPDALGLAIPLVISLSTAVSANAGILVKDRLALERMRSIDTVLFDKTGTPRGAHVVTGVSAAGGLDESAVLHLVRDDEVVGALALEDEVRPEAREAVTDLQQMGVKVE